METWINQILQSEHAGISVLFAVFLLGFIGVISCGCNYAIIGIVAGYTGSIGSTGKSKIIWWSGIFFLIGTVISMAIIGALLGYAGELISNSFGMYWKIIAGLIMILFGLVTLDFIPVKVPAFNFKSEKNKNSVLAAILFGLTVGGLASAFNSCCSPIFPIMLAVSFIKGSMLWGMIMLIAFALGYGLPLAIAMVGIGLGLGKISKTAAIIGKVIKYAGGTALIVSGFYFLLTI